MSNYQQDWLALAQACADQGERRPDRTGVGTRALFARQLRHSMADGFPLLTTKKTSFHNIKVEVAV